MKSSLKNTLKILTILTVIFIMTLAAIIIYLNSSAGKNFIKDQIKTQIKSNLNLKAEIGSLETDIFSYLNLSEITIYPDKYTKSDPLINLKRLQIKYSIYDLIFSKRINYILADSLSLFVTRNSLGIFNLPVLSEETDTGTDGAYALPLKVNLAEIKHVNTFYNDDFIPLKSRLSNLGIRIEKTDTENFYDIETSIDSLSLGYFKEPIEVSNFSLTGLLNDNLVIMPALLKGKLSGLNFRGSLSSDEETISGDFVITGTLQNLATIISGDNSLDFSEDINVDLKYKIKDYMSSPDITVKILMDSYKADNIQFKDFNLAGIYRSDTLSLTNLSFEISGGTLLASGWMSFDSLLSHKFSLNINDFDIKRSELNPAGEYISGPLLADFYLNSEGYLSDLKLLNIKSGLKLFTYGSDVINASVALKEGYLSVSSDSAPVLIKSGIHLDNRGYSGLANIRLTNLEVLSMLLDFSGVEGTIQTTSSINGSWSEIGLKTMINSAGIYYKGIKVIDTLAAALNLHNGNIFIDSSYAGGYINNLNSISSLFGFDSMGGSVTYSSYGKGNIENPGFIFNAEVLEPVLGPVSLDNVSISVKVGIDTISIPEFRLKKDSVLASVNGKINLKELTGNFQTNLYNSDSTKSDTLSLFFKYNSAGEYKGQVSSDKLHLETISGFLPELEVNSGELNMDLSFSYSDNRIQAHLPFTISNLKRKKLSINSVTGNIVLEDNNFLIDSLVLRIGNNSARFSSQVELQRDKFGSYFIDENSRTKGYLYGNDLELDLINPIIENYANITGISDLDLQWNGSLNNPHLKGKININNSHINLADTVKLFSDINGSIKFEDSLIRINNLTADMDKTPLILNAQIRRQYKTKLSARMRIASNDILLMSTDAIVNGDSLVMNLEIEDMPLTMAGNLFPFMRDVNGVFSSKLLIEGDLYNPGFNGKVRIKNISYNPNIMNLNISNGRIIAHLSNSRAVLDTGFFNIGKGSLSAHGNILFDNHEFNHININVSGSNLTISEPDYFSLNINNADLNIRQQDERYKLAGFVHFGPSRYKRNFELTNLWEIFIAKTEGVIENKSSEESLDLTEYIEEYQLKLINFSDYFRKLDLDLTIKDSDSIWVKNNVADFRIHPDLTLRGSFETPLLSGRVNVEEDGKIKFLDRYFDLKTAAIEFENSERINLYLNIKAESDVTSKTGIEEEDRTYRIILGLTGPLDDFDFNLISDPTLDNIDIISLLTLGMTYQQFQASQNANSALQNRAGVLTTLELSNRVNNYYQELMGNIIQIDRIGIGGNVFSPGEARLEITKRWADRVEVSYSTAVDNLEKQILKAKLKLIKYFYIEGQTDQETESGVDLIFRYRFK